jgi:hypothetical protein
VWTNKCDRDHFPVANGGIHTGAASAKPDDRTGHQGLLQHNTEQINISQVLSPGAAIMRPNPAGAGLWSSNVQRSAP